MNSLLQTGFGTQMVDSADTTTVIIVVVLIAVVFIFLIIAGAVSNRRAASGRSGKKISRGSFRRRAARMGLTKVHVRALEFIIDRYKVRNPYALLANPAVLDNYLRKAIQGVEDQVSSDQSKEAQKHTLYRIKQIIERNSEKAGTYTNTRQLKINQGVAISTNGSDRYQSRVVSILKDSLAIEVPVGDTGNQLRWKKWSKVKVYFWKSNGQGYSFNSKLIGYNRIKGVAAAFVQHSNKIEKSKQRRYRRRPLDRPCYFYPVRVLTAGSGRNQTKKAFVETKRGSLGTVIEVSAGGCSLRASRTLPKGSLIKIDFETNRGVPVSSFGKVVDMRKEEIMGYIMNIMFTRVSRKNLNSINAFVYEYGDAG